MRKVGTNSVSPHTQPCTFTSYAMRIVTLHRLLVQSCSYYWLDDWGIALYSQRRNRDSVQIGWDPPSLISNGYRGSSADVWKTDYSPLCSASTPSYAFVTKHRDNYHTFHYFEWRIHQHHYRHHVTQGLSPLDRSVSIITNDLVQSILLWLTTYPFLWSFHLFWGGGYFMTLSASRLHRM
jgi:hypothetical protein